MDQAVSIDHLSKEDICIAVSKQTKQNVNKMWALSEDISFFLPHDVCFPFDSSLRLPHNRKLITI